MMKKGIVLLLLSFGVSAFANTPSNAADTLIDQQGISTINHSAVENTATTLAVSPRIISLSPAATELIYDLGLENHLLAIDKNSNYPEQTKQLQSIGDAFSPNRELLTLLNPDIVISFSLSPVIEQAQQQLQFKLLIMQPKNIDELLTQAQRLAQQITKTKQPTEEANHNQQQAQQSIKQWQHRWDTLKKQYTQAPKKKAFVFLGTQPIYALGKETFLSQSLQTCGAENMFPHIKQSAFILSAEELILNPPDIIIAGIASSEHYPTKQAEIQKALEKIGVNIHSNNILLFDEDILFRPSIRFLNHLPQLCEAIQQHKVEQ
ncbi:ABC transporter substrate-binding protein [Pelistega ratti]|uniref:ABC transporter substrate-binding protein n=1 Tax=Pelistega ratti TaxID=2652177 RepID=UPI0013590D85|nr:ABC transporter substrate-binding protein [Pelistega ratti]